MYRLNVANKVIHQNNVVLTGEENFFGRERYYDDDYDAIEIENIAKLSASLKENPICEFNIHVFNNETNELILSTIVKVKMVEKEFDINKYVKYYQASYKILIPREET